MFEAERRELETATRERLARYVENRRKSYEALAALDPEAGYTKAARQLLDRALQVQADYLARLDPDGQGNRSG